MEGNRPRINAPAWLWPNLLSLDAPLVAVAWMWMLAKALRVEYIEREAWWVLALVVWCVYVADRLLDAWRNPEMRWSSPRHMFQWRWRWPLLFGVGVGVVVSSYQALYVLPRAIFSAGLVAVMLCFIYFSLAYYGRRAVPYLRNSLEWAIFLIFLVIGFIWLCLATGIFSQGLLISLILLVACGVTYCLLAVVLRYFLLMPWKLRPLLLYPLRPILSIPAVKNAYRALLLNLRPFIRPLIRKIRGAIEAGIPYDKNFLAGMIFSMGVGIPVNVATSSLLITDLKDVLYAMEHTGIRDALWNFFVMVLNTLRIIFYGCKEVVLFGLLCMMNITAIDLWEKARDESDEAISYSHEATLTLGLIMLAGGSLLFAAMRADEFNKPYFYAVMVAAALLQVINHYRERFSMNALRAMADVALLAPLPIFLVG